MTEIKKTYNNPPSGLIKAVLKNSSSEIWETAKEEWKFYKYYYNTTQKPVFCPCSAREINHIVVIKTLLQEICWKLTFVVLKLILELTK